MRLDDGPTLWTIGHSTRTWPDFLALLREHRIGRLVDVRQLPRSRHVPWTDRDALRPSLDESGIRYEHVVDLGGFRRPRPDSPNTGLRSAGFRGYADHMATDAFGRALERLLGLLEDERVGVMCAEAVPWRCHRSILSDAFVARGARVIHILAPGAVRDHTLSPIAVVHDGRVTYPGTPAKRLKRPRG